nr:MetaGeneMark_Unknown Function [uncultured bacterium]
MNDLLLHLAGSRIWQGVFHFYQYLRPNEKCGDQSVESLQQPTLKILNALFSSEPRSKW